MIEWVERRRIVSDS